LHPSLIFAVGDQLRRHVDIQHHPAPTPTTSAEDLMNPLRPSATTTVTVRLAAAAPPR
jgi:hypothetical protein